MAHVIIKHQTSQLTRWLIPKGGSENSNAAVDRVEARGKNTLLSHYAKMLLKDKDDEIDQLSQQIYQLRVELAKMKPKVMHCANTEQNMMDITVFMQGCASPHIGTKLEYILQEPVQDGIISHFSSCELPLHSMDLTLADFYLLDCLKSYIYHGNLVQFQDLKDAIVCIPDEMCGFGMIFIVTRMKCIPDGRGAHFEQLL